MSKYSKSWKGEQVNKPSLISILISYTLASAICLWLGYCLGMALIQ